MKALLSALILLATTVASAQTLILTEARHAPGQRILMVNGSFLDADSVYLQVYHDGDELYSEPVYVTWQLTLGEFEHYDLKFTDEQGRVKRISFHELSDNQIEDFPPIEVDFTTAGNVVYIKQRTGKLDWFEYDVGMSRK